MMSEQFEGKRIAELEREIAELEATNAAAPTWGAAVGALCEIIKGRHAELSRLRISRLRNEPSLRYDNPAPDASAPSVPLGSVRNATLTAAYAGHTLEGRQFDDTDAPAPLPGPQQKMDEYERRKASGLIEAAEAVVRCWDAQKLGLIDPSVNTDLSSAIEYLRARAAYRSGK